MSPYHGQGCIFWLRIAIIFNNSQSKESQVKEYTMNIAYNHAPSACPVLECLCTCILARVLTFVCTYSLVVEIEMNLCRYFKSTFNTQPSTAVAYTKALCEPLWLGATCNLLPLNHINRVPTPHNIITSPQFTPLAKVEVVACLLGNSKSWESH